MNGKQVFQAGVGVAGLVVLAACGLQAKDVAYGASEFTGAGGPLTGAGIFAGASGFLYSLVTLGKTALSYFSGGGGANDKIIGGGMAILQSLVSGKVDAVGLTKHAAVAILFADAVNSGDKEYLESVMAIARKALSLDPAVPPVAKS